MARSIDGTYRVFRVQRHDAAEPACDTDEWTDVLPIPAMRDVLIDREFVRLEYVTGTMKVTITCEDYPEQYPMEESEKNRERALEAHQRSSMWLFEANVAAEKGNKQREEMALRKAQYWLDRLNKLEGLVD